MKNIVISFFFLSLMQFIRSQIEYQLLSPQNNTYNSSEPSFPSGYVFNFCFSDPPQCFNLLYDTICLSSFFPDKTVRQCKNTFDTAMSKYLVLDNHFTSLYIHNGSVIGKDARDRVDPGEESLYKFLIANAYYLNTAFFDGIISLLRIYIEAYKDFSIINYYYNTKKIKRRMFAHKFINDNEGILYIGDIGKEYIPAKQSCKSNIKGLHETLWGCRLKHIEIGDSKKIAVGDEALAVFSVGVSNILGPYQIGREIILHYFTLCRNFCYTVDSSLDGIMLMSCKEFDISTLPTLSFILKGHTITLKQRDLFFRTDIHRFEFVIKAEQKRTTWELGLNALRNEFMIFDMDAQEVSFVINGSKSTMFNMLIITKVLCLFGLLIEGYVFIRNGIIKVEFGS